MTDADILKLKEACEKFYLNSDNESNLTDLKFDELRKDYEQDGKSIKDLIQWPVDLTIQSLNDPKVDKTSVTGNNLASAIINDLTNCDIDDNEYYLNLKYDGGAIAIRYDRLGNLKIIQSTPFNTIGLVRTEQFWDLVPHHIDPKLGIECIRGEVLVDADVYGELARNKANGLINSTVSQDEVYNEAFIRFYSLIYFNDNDSITWKQRTEDLSKIPTIKLTRTRKINDGNKISLYQVTDSVFKLAYQFKSDDKDFPTNAINKFPGDPYFQLDGIVVYCKDWIYAYKYYYTKSIVTKVNDIIWTRQLNGGYSATISFDEVTLNDKSVSKASSGGISNMISMKMGIGAEVKVILANLTIPKIIEVLTPSDNYNYPKCECGYQLSDKDIYGSTLKCGNTNVCCKKVELWMPQIISELSNDGWWKDDLSDLKYHTVRDIVINHPEWFGDFLYIDRWTSDKLNGLDRNQLRSIGYQLINILSNIKNTYLKDNEITELIELMDKIYFFSELQHDIMCINISSTMYCLSRLINIMKEQLIKLNEENKG